MKTGFLILVLAHGFLHLLGFVKAFEFKPLPQLILPISKPLGLIWLAAAIAIVVYAALFFLQHRTAWVVGFLAIGLSQTLIIMNWQDARFGTIPNVVILLVVLVFYNHLQFSTGVKNEIKQLLMLNQLTNRQILANDQIRQLPEPVQAWLRACGAVGHEVISNGHISQKAQMKMKQGQADWYTATATQYSGIAQPAFVWTVDLPLNTLLHFNGRDKFENGKGEMVIKLNAMINIVSAKGAKIDESSLQRFLGEMVWLPSLALSPYVNWEAIDATRAKATMTYGGTTGNGTFYFNDQGDVIKFVALRFQGNDPEAVRREWILTVDDYQIFNGIKVPSKMKATWKLEQNDWTWLQLEVTGLKYNVLPMDVAQTR